MAKVVVVTSGKGGVGKTTSTAALGAALAQSGANVVVVDFDVGLRNLDLVMGAERRVVFDLINVIQGDAKLAQALIRDKRIDTLSLLPASQTRDKDALTAEGVAKVIAELREKFDWVICDSPAGIEKGAMLAMRHADIAIVVTNPEVSSVRDSDRIIGLLDSKTEGAERGDRIEKHLLLTRYDPARAARGEMLKTEDVLEILSIPLLGIIPESEEVLRASNLGSPVTLLNPPARRPAPMSMPRGGCAARWWRWWCRWSGRASSAGCSGGGWHEPDRPVPPPQLRPGGARAAASLAGARTRPDRAVRSARGVAGGDSCGDRQAHHHRPRQGADQAGPRRPVSTLEIDVEVPSIAKLKVAASA